MKPVHEPAPAKLDRRSCTYWLFRNSERPELFCAVPDSHPLPSFLGPQQWEFERPLRPWQDRPGFRERAAEAGVRLNGFYLFQATARPAEDDKQSLAEPSSADQPVREALLCLQEHQSLLRQTTAGASDPAVTPDGRPAASLKWMERRYAEMLEALPTAIYATDAVGRITFYNQAAVALWGRCPALGQDRWCGSWRIYRCDGTPLPHDRCPMAVAIQENREVRGVTAVAERPDGTRVPFLPFPTPLHDANDNLVGAVNVLVGLAA